MDIIRPLALIDEDRCRTNIRRIATKLKRLGIVYRPHFKTHQSREIGNWFRDEGVEAITVSTIGMAEYFAKDNWTEITIAFPLVPSQLNRINKLAEQVNLKIFLTDPEVIDYYDKYLDHPVGVYIELDAGHHRCGIRTDQPDKIFSTVKKLRQCKLLNPYGFYIHEGRTYEKKGKTAVREVLQPVFNFFQDIKSEYPDSRICMGDTPGCSMLDEFPGVDEMSAGNSVFYDLMQVEIGSCSPEDIALAVLCPLIEVKPNLNEAILYGGAVHFSKDRILWNGKEIFGRPSHYNRHSFGAPVKNSYIRGVSQEHGMLTGDPDWMKDLKPGDPICILPIHSCLTANLYDHYLTLDGQRIEKKVLS